MIGDFNDKTNFPHKLLLTNTQVSMFRKAFANNSSANIELSKTQLSKIGQSKGYLGRLLRPLIKTGLALTKNELKPLAKCFNTIRINSSGISNRCSYSKQKFLGHAWLH